MKPAPAEPVILGDWGSTRLRLWLRHGGSTLAAVEAPGLIVAEQGPTDVLRAALDSLGTGKEGCCRIILCGMAGARGGLAEAGYVACPGGTGEWIGGAVETALDGYRVTILPGFSRRDDRGRPDVMRGEEAQVFGALALRHGDPDRPAQIVLPGTHSKWVRARLGRIVDFTTVPTGELRARLLGSSLAPEDPGGDPDANAEGFSAGLERAVERAALMTSLFETRAAQVFDGRSGDWARGFLSGLLIGSEVAAMFGSVDRAASVLLVGGPELTTRYRAAFARFGLDCQAAAGETRALEGLEIAHAGLG